MTPVQILRDIITIAQAIKSQVDTAKNNKRKLGTLLQALDLLISALAGLDKLPNNQQFIKSLSDFQTCILGTQELVIKITAIGKMRGFFYAQKIEHDLNACKQHIIEFIPILNLGLNAQLLMDRERDRRDAEADKEAFLAQKEQELQALHEAARIERGERDAIILKQLASVKQRLAQPLVAPLLPEAFLVNLYDIVFEEKIEENDFGSVYQGSWQEQAVTIKCFDHIATKSERGQLIREAQVMSHLHHETVTRFYGACLDQERPCLLTGLLEGNLESLLAILSLDERFMMAKDLARGLAYLHERGVIHGDIHPKHIGIDRYKKAQWTDLGLAKVRTAGIATSARVSHEAAWQAPESFQKRAELSTRSDVYSFGVLLWTLASGRLPYANMSASEVRRLVQNGERESISDEVPAEYGSLIRACWSSQRPTAKQIAQRLMTIDGFRASSPTGEAYYERGVAAERAGNMVQAYHDYHRASEKQYTKSLTSLGLFSLQGLGGQAVDKQKAEDYLKTAAEAGHGRAMYNLGRMHERGETIAGIADAKTALFWYQKAHEADSKDERSAKKLAMLTGSK